MFKKVLFFLFVIIIMSCSTSQPIVRTSKPIYKKPHPTVVSSTKKKIPSKPKPVAVQSTQKKPTSPNIVLKKPAASPIVLKKPNQSISAPEIKEIEKKYEAAKEENKSNANQTVYSKTEILEATTRVKVTKAMVLDYIDTYKEIAKSNMKEFGIPASIILGQGILESGAGTGPLSVLANNHFGIKCHLDWSGPSINYDDDTEQECFRKYDESMKSYEDHAIFLVNRAWYKPLFDLEKDDYKLWAKGLKNAGYATDPKYPEKLIAIIERYQLNQYDAEVLGKTYIPLVSATKIAANNSDLYQVTPGDTLYSISKKFNISIEDLKRFNAIQDDALSVGQNLKVK